jgi:hypothetical protein
MRKGSGSVYKWNISVVICDTYRGTLGSVAFLLVATLYQGNPDRNHKPWNIT